MTASPTAEETPGIAAHWKASAGMPLRTRALGLGLALRNRTPLADLSLPELIKRRTLLPPPKAPATWVTGVIAAGVNITTQQMPTRDGGSIPLRVLRSESPTGSASSKGADASTDRVLLWLHGGGWTLGQPVDYDALLSFVVAQTGCVVLVPDYRLAPEHKAPAAVHDSLDALDWIVGGGVNRWVGAHPRIVVGGDSAGGNLAALAALHARDNGVDLCGQLLSYPATDLDATRPYRNAPMLSGADMDAFEGFYLTGSGLTGSSPVISPAHAASHCGLTRALVQTAEMDPLRAEGERYAALLEESGVPTRYTCYRGAPHGFLSMPGATHVGYQARWELVDTLERWWR